MVVLMFIFGMIGLAVLAMVVQARWERGVPNEDPRRSEPGGTSTIADRGMGSGTGLSGF